MGGGWSTKRSIIVNDADSKVNLKKIGEESKEEMNTKNESKLEIRKGSKLHFYIPIRAE